QAALGRLIALHAVDNDFRLLVGLLHDDAVSDARAVRHVAQGVVALHLAHHDDPAEAPLLYQPVEVAFHGVGLLACSNVDDLCAGALASKPLRAAPYPPCARDFSAASRSSSSRSSTVRGSTSSRSSSRRTMMGGRCSRSRRAAASGERTVMASARVGSVSPGRLPPPTTLWLSTTSASSPACVSASAQARARTSSSSSRMLIIRHTGTLCSASPRR